ncbi:xanthine dehydrogenase YagT iron-sulfur-binding subunit [Endobacter medicaginis]|uniref:Xanthine dehydrogenase YagT iron-sulfur-binding subunit n=2 Tax=Endobacter medicaginis TaxID=1181271 RepID=A0A839V284_9PROT|nr:2Fe-2S iron-sulfur cluster-binding protein [Endobacter medicaginis]MBB3174590.1 xanthine dehydrogenase YagT iron-sulfur-binding subunit [Endobacter medicaginis]MCX5474718.1 2Fe-2S iron-sulfur cluster-binding protein [Endobacter medicaginis]
MTDPDRPSRTRDEHPPGRRALLQAGAALGLAGGLDRPARAEPTPAAPPAKPAGAHPVARKVAKVAVTLSVNGQKHALSLDPRTTLLDALRETLRLTGTKKGCDHGQCGACTVLLDGVRINACLTLAVMHDNIPITTIEGVGGPDHLHALQQHFIDHDAFQCGYCTPGQICSALGMLGELKSGAASHVSAKLDGPHEASAAELRERMSGNLCRCAAYPNIIAAITDFAGKAA